MSNAATLQRPTIHTAAANKQKTAAAAASQAGDQWLNQWLNNTTNHSTKRQGSSNNSKAIAGDIPCSEEKEQLSTVSFLPPDVLIASITREINYCNEGTQIQSRREALNRIKHMMHIDRDTDIRTTITIGEPLTAALSVETIDTLTSLLVKPMLKRCTDDSEVCRSSAISILQRLLHASSFDAFTATLPYVMPVLVYRMNIRDLTSASQPLSAENPCRSFPNGKQTGNNTEQSEELRQQLLQIGEIVIQRYHQQSSSSSSPSLSLSVFLPDLVTLIGQACTDRSPVVLTLGCELLQSLCTTHTQQLRAASTFLTRILTPLLSHTHAALRTLTINTLSLLIPLGAAECIRDLTAFREHNLIDIHGFYHGEYRINSLAVLVNDHNSRVRHALYCCLSYWMCSMQEHSDYETLLMPYIFTGLHDTHADNRDVCKQTLDSLGREYQADHEQEIEEEMRYGREARDSTATTTSTFLSFPDFAYPTTRPALAVRLFTQRFLDRLFHAIQCELQDWHEHVTSQALLLLRTLLFFAEDNVIVYIQPVLSSTSKLYGKQKKQEGGGNRQDTGVLCDVWHLLGRYAPSELLIQRWQECCQSEQEEAETYLKVLEEMITTMQAKDIQQYVLPALQECEEVVHHVVQYANVTVMATALAEKQ